MNQDDSIQSSKGSRALRDDKSALKSEGNIDISKTGGKEMLNYFEVLKHSQKLARITIQQDSLHVISGHLFNSKSKKKF